MLPLDALAPGGRLANLLFDSREIFLHGQPVGYEVAELVAELGRDLQLGARSGDHVELDTVDTRGMVTTQQRGRIVSELAVLDVEELAISARRHDLHQRLDTLYLGAPLGVANTSLLNRLEDEEIVVSAQRRGLHERIDVLRVRVGLPPTRKEIAAGLFASVI